MIYGGSTAGIGITDTIFRAVSQNGLSEAEARKLFLVIVDRTGLLTELSEDVIPVQQPYLRTKDEIKNSKIEDPHQISLLDLMENIKPTILIGTSAHGHTFNQTIVKTMLKYVAKPIIFHLSNPTKKCEAEPIDLFQWTKGKALIATGSPFEDIIFKNKKFLINQCNNYLAFPEIGLGVIAN